MPADRLTPRHWLLLLVLAAVQVTHIIDFMLLMPLAPQLEADLNISTPQFGVLISAYGFSAAICGLLLASLLDRFDRKASLLVLYAGFTLGTAFCAAAPDYRTLFLGRVIAGGFGGVVASVVLAIVGDAFPPSRRGTAMGAVMSGFSFASVAGVPAGLWLAHTSAWGWRAPFAVLACASVALGLLAWAAMPPVRTHLSALHRPARLREIATHPPHVRAYLLMVSLVFSTFMVVPYIAAFLVKNVGVDEGDVYLVYLVGGTATLVSMNLIGRLSDRLPRLLVFRCLAGVALLTIVGLTNLPPGWPLPLVLGATTAMMVFTSGRMVPGMAMITSVAHPRNRGSFLSINSSVQQFAAGSAPLLSALLLGGEKGGPIVGFPLVGWIAGAFGVGSLVLAGGLTVAAAPAAAPAMPAGAEQDPADAIVAAGALAAITTPASDFSPGEV